MQTNSVGSFQRRHVGMTKESDFGVLTPTEWFTRASSAPVSSTTSTWLASTAPCQRINLFGVRTQRTARLVRPSSPRTLTKHVTCQSSRAISHAACSQITTSVQRWARSIGKAARLFTIVSVTGMIYYLRILMRAINLLRTASYYSELPYPH